MLDEIKEIESGEWDSEIKNLIDQGKKQALKGPRSIVTKEDLVSPVEQPTTQPMDVDEESQKEGPDDSEFGMILDTNEKEFQNGRNDSRMKSDSQMEKAKPVSVPEKQEWTDSMSNIGNR